MSDLKGRKSDAAAVYGVRTIPATVLIDANGVIVACNLRGKELLDKISSMLD